MIKVSSKVKINSHRIKQLTQAQVTALEQTAEALHTEIVQAQVVPRKDGTLQGEAFFVDTTESGKGKVALIHATPYARRLYFHPEYHFHKEPWEEYYVETEGKKRWFDTKEEAKEYAGKDMKIHHLTHEGNPHAKGKWFADYEPGGKYQDFAIDAYKKIYRRIAGL